MVPEVLRHEPLITGPLSAAQLDEQVLCYPERKPPRAWFIAFSVAASAMTLGFALIGFKSK